MDETSSRDWERLVELIWGCALSQAIHVAVDLGLPEQLYARDMDCAELARMNAVDEEMLDTVLRALSAFDIVASDYRGRYRLTSMGRLLRPSAERGCQWDAGEFFPLLYRPLEHLGTAIRGGGTAFVRGFGSEFYDHLAAHAGLADSFYAKMAANGPARYADLLVLIDVGPAAHVVDVGGGDGGLLEMLLDRNPGWTAELVELPAAAQRARDRMAGTPLAERIRIAEGDFLDGVPPGADLYLLANVVNNLPVAVVQKLYRRLAQAMRPGAKTIVLEPIYLETANARWRSLVSLGVLAQRGGRARDEAMHRRLLEGTGLTITAIGGGPYPATSAIELERC
jgi:hypothetical protein